MKIYVVICVCDSECDYNESTHSMWTSMEGAEKSAAIAQAEIARDYPDNNNTRYTIDTWNADVEPVGITEEEAIARITKYH